MINLVGFFWVSTIKMFPTGFIGVCSLGSEKLFETVSWNKGLNLWVCFGCKYLQIPGNSITQRCVIVIKIIRLRLRLYELVLGNRNRLQLPLFFVRLNRMPIDWNLMFYIAARENSERKDKSDIAAAMPRIHDAPPLNSDKSFVLQWMQSLSLFLSIFFSNPNPKLNENLLMD